MAEKIVMSPAQAMRLAIHEAKKGHGWVSPNPVVGCVILDSNGFLLSSGYHKKLGGPHAEIEALAAISDSAQLNGAHVFVTLEPCSHFGRTPPCAEALAKLPLREVTFGLYDPNPKVSGRGAEILRAAGIKCSSWSEFSSDDSITLELEELAEIFLFNQREQKTFVALKVATSLDGRMALRSGESKWITGEAARTWSHELRKQYDCVLIGKKTFLDDNPSLNIRLSGYEKYFNAVVVLDPRGETISRITASALAKVRPIDKIYVAVSEGYSRAASDAELKILRVKLASNGQLDIDHLLLLLWQNDLRSVFVEGGAKTFATFLSRFQRLHLFLAPHLIGGAYGISWTESFGSEKMSDRLKLSPLRSISFGDDLYLSLKATAAIQVRTKS